MRTIVLGYDGSDTAARAAAEAAELAQACGAELHIVNVLDDGPRRHGMSTQAIDDAVEGEAGAVNAALVERFDPGLRVQTHIEWGSPAMQLIQYADDLDADLIVVGNRRVQGLSRILGSVAVEVLRYSPCSVYVAHTVP